MVPLHCVEPTALDVPMVASMVTNTIEDVAQPIEAHDDADDGRAKRQGQEREDRNDDDRGQVPRNADEVIGISMVQGMSYAQK